MKGTCEMSKTKKTPKPPQFDYLFPPDACELVYQVLDGRPGLDPCGHPQQFLEAETTLYGMGAEDDGMLASWREHKSVFFNAAHGEREPDWEALDEIGVSKPDWTWYAYSKWITKASVEAQAGATVFGFMPASTDRKWFHHYAVAANSIAFLEQRVKCYIPGVRDEPPVQGPQPMNSHMLVLWTSDKKIADRFYEVLKSRAMIVEPIPVTA